MNKQARGWLTPEELLYDELNDNHVNLIESTPFMKQWIIEAMERYADQQSDLVQELFTNPAEKLKPLEDLWRKEHYPDGKYVIPDTTQFYEWIVKKFNQV